MDDLLREFLIETGEHLDTVDVELVRFEREPGDRDILRNIFRLVHTIKGTCGFLGLPRLEALAHAAETLMEGVRDERIVAADCVTLILATVDRLKLILSELERLQAEPAGSDADLIGELHRASTSLAAAKPAPSGRPPSVPPRIEAAGPASILPPEVAPPEAGPPPLREEARAGNVQAGNVQAGQVQAQTVRVGIDTLDHLMTMVSELVLTRNQLLEHARRHGGTETLQAPLQRLSNVTAELQDGVMKTRMHPIGSAWAKLPRLVRDLTRELGKPIELAMTGAETELDRQILEIVRDPLTHLIRNAADHGLEAAAARVAAGKPACGTIRLHAFNESGAITIEIADDGRGLDFAGIGRQAVARGLVPAAEIGRLSERELAELIFEPGFSTSASINAVSGRGIGMDVVRSNIMKVGGTIETVSEPGRGTTFRIKIPLTLAIVTALIVEIGGQRFALPQVCVEEVVRAAPGTDHAIRRVNGTALLRLRGSVLPVIDVAGLLRLPHPGEADSGYVIVTKIGQQRVGLFVTSVINSEEIVVKPISAKLRDIEIFAGHTILGDGAVVLIVDPNALGRRVGQDVLRNADLDEARSAPAAELDTVTLLVMRARDLGMRAVPLSLVTRLEEVDAGAIEWLGPRPMLQYHGRLIPIVYLDEDAVPLRSGPQALVIVADGERVMGLAVHEIVDIVDVALDIRPVASRPDLVGSAIVRGRATEIVDIAAYLPRAHGDWVALSGRAQAAGTVLLVDDNPFFLALLGPVLKAAGFKVRPAAGRDEALRALAEGGPVDAVVTDLDLAGQAGLDLVEAIRRRPDGAGLPIVGLSSGADDATLDRARALGIYDVVAKFDRSGLISALGEARMAWGEAA